MNKQELEALLEELDDALVQAFPEAEPISVLVVGGAFLVLSDLSARQTKDIDVIVFDWMGTGPASFAYNPSKDAKRVKEIIGNIGIKHGLGQRDKYFVNDDCASFILEISVGKIPEMRIFHAYRKIHLHFPEDPSFVLACKLMAGRDKDLEDIALLRKKLDIHTRAAALALVNRYFPMIYHHHLYELPRTLRTIFPE